MTAPLIAYEDFCLTYAGGNRAVRGVSFALSPGECLALVGESGCGKTSIARAAVGLLPASARVSGRILFEGQDLAALDEHDFRTLRGRRIGYVAQDPFDSCDPLSTIADHVAEPFKAHGLPITDAEIAARLKAIGIADAANRMAQYPHQWSGGMLQRAAIAAATAHRPPLIVADEPTSALDADMADLTLSILRRAGTAVLLISHDLDLVARHADRIAVCYAGRIVEIGEARRIARAPRHPYTIGLARALPREKGVLPAPLPGSPPALDAPIPGCAFAPRCPEADTRCHTEAPALSPGIACWNVTAATAAPPPLPRIRRRTDAAIVLEAGGLLKRYGALEAVSHADLTARRGEIVGIGGPSGCGKSTLLRLIGTLEAPDAGTLTLGFPTRLKRLPGGRIAQRAAPGMVMPVFQDPSGSLDPRWPVWRSVIEPESRGRWTLDLSARKRAAKAHLDAVGLGHIDIEARPGELSLGQCQRVSIARALAARPALVIADEPTSALDAAATANVLSLLDALARAGSAIVIVSHDRLLLESLCDRVLEMRDGVLREEPAPQPERAAGQRRVLMTPGVNS